MDNVKTFSKILEETGHLAYITRGFSMLPLLRQGKDVVVIEKKEERYRKYDTVLFQRGNGSYVLHRILKVLDDGYWIVGDNCISGENVKDNQILGIMTSVKRNGKTINVTDWKYLLYVHLWCDIYPLRFLILRIKRFVFRCIRFVKRRVFG